MSAKKDNDVFKAIVKDIVDKIVFEETEAFNVDLFNEGLPVDYAVNYIGYGPVKNKIPAEIIKKKNAIRGFLIFSKTEVIFMDEKCITHMLCNIDLNENEKLIFKNKIIAITGCQSSLVDPQIFYFDVSIDDNENEVVYRPKFVNLARILQRKE